MEQAVDVGAIHSLSIDEFRLMVGTTIGVSAWHCVSQSDIRAFADATKDHQFIHVDEERAKAGPFGGTIAHGMYSLSLISVMFEEAVPPVEGAAANVNYGFDKVRFLSPVPSGSEIDGSFTLVGIDERGKGQFLFRYNVTMNIKDVVKPAVHAEWLVMHVLA